MNDKGLGDSWRMINPSSRECSYFYPLHHSSSWTDLFLISTSLTQNIHNNKMNPITISGHAPVSLSINIQTQIKPPMRWCSNTSLLQDLTEELVSFLQMNDSPEISPWLLWETVIKGKIISYSSYKKKQPKQRIEQLTNFCSNNPTEQIRKEPQNPTWQNLKQKNAILNPTTQIWNLSIGQQNREIFSKSTTTQKRKINNYHNYQLQRGNHPAGTTGNKQNLFTATHTPPAMNLLNQKGTPSYTNYRHCQKDRQITNHPGRTH